MNTKAIVMKVAIRKMGNSRGVIIPRPLLLQAGLEKEAEMSVEKGSIVLRRPTNDARVGWAVACQHVASNDAVALEWVEFANAIDADIEW